MTKIKDIDYLNCGFANDVENKVLIILRTKSNKRKNTHNCNENRNDNQMEKSDVTNIFAVKCISHCELCQKSTKYPVDVHLKFHTTFYSLPITQTTRSNNKKKTMATKKEQQQLLSRE